MAENDLPQNDEKKAGKGTLGKWSIVAAAVIVLGAGGIFGYFEFVADRSVRQRDAAEQEAANVVFPLDSFIVNLAENNGLGKRYLKLTMSLETTEETKAALKQRDPQIRDTVLLLLSSQRFSDISSVEGKMALKASLLTRINELLGKELVSHIFFTEFVIQ